MTDDKAVGIFSLIGLQQEGCGVRIPASPSWVGEGASVEATNNYGGTPLHVAAWTGHLEIVKFLVSRGASVDATDNWSETPLHETAHFGYLETAKFLVGEGASLTATDNWSETPRALAARNGHTALVEYFDSL